jgi:hypothetical protein
VTEISRGECWSSTTRTMRRSSVALVPIRARSSRWMSSISLTIPGRLSQLVFDLRAAFATLARLLKPGGTLYVTVPGITPGWGEVASNGVDYWRFTAASVRTLMLEHFAPEDVFVEAFGNVLAAVGFLHGLAAEEFSPAELDLRDPAYETLIAARAHKAPDAIER